MAAGRRESIGGEALKEGGVVTGERVPFSKALRVMIFLQLRPDFIMAKSASTWSAAGPPAR